MPRIFVIGVMIAAAVLVPVPVLVLAQQPAVEPEPQPAVLEPFDPVDWERSFAFCTAQIHRHGPNGKIRRTGVKDGTWRFGSKVFSVFRRPGSNRADHDFLLRKHLDAVVDEQRLIVINATGTRIHSRLLGYNDVSCVESEAMRALREGPHYEASFFGIVGFPPPCATVRNSPDLVIGTACY